MIKFLLMLLVTTNLYAATVWTPQSERYNTYNTTPTKTTQKLVRVKVGDIDSVQPEWAKLDGEFIKEVSSGGAVRYVKAIAPLVDECIGKFVCHQKWGWVVNISEDTVFGKCKAIKILNEQVVMYDNRVKDINCPTVLK